MDIQQWTVLASSIVFPACGAIWMLIQWFSGRKDKEREREQTHEEKREAELERERKYLAESHEKTIKDMHEDMENYRRLVREKNIERFKAWDRAHFWHGKAWDMRNEAAHARQVAESVCRLANLEMPKWNGEILLPPFDDELKASPPSQSASVRSG